MKHVMSVLIVVSLLFCGCTHQLRLTNGKLNPSLSTPPKPVSVGFVQANFGDDTLIPGAIKELSLSPAVKSVKMNCQISADTNMEYFCEMNKTMNYRASGQNFFITFPGFILFTHSWLGYKYYVDVTTQSKIMDPAGKELDVASILTPYEIRYTSFPRGAASSLIGWCTPGFGALDIIPGAIFMGSYDKRATPEFIEAAKPSYATFVSSKILEQIVKVQGKGQASAGQPVLAMDPVVIDDDPTSLISATENTYAVSIWKDQQGAFVPQDSEIKELSAATIGLMRDSWSQGAAPTIQDLRTILFSLGLSEEDIPTTMAHVNIYSVQGDRVVALYRGDTSKVKLALK